MGFGDYTRYVNHTEDPFDTRVHAFRDDTVDSLPDKFENWDKEHVREAVEGLMREDQKHQDRAVTARMVLILLHSIRSTSIRTQMLN